MKAVYIAHPISNDVEGNIHKIEKLVNHLIRTAPEVMPVVPYLVWLNLLDNSIPRERRRGMDMNKPYFTRRFIDELWICGERTEGVLKEIEWCEEFEIDIRDMTKWAAEIISGDLYIGEFTQKGIEKNERGNFSIKIKKV